MSKSIAVGIDIGTYHVKVVVAERSDTSDGMPSILGVGVAESKGLRHGYVINHNDAVRSVRKAVRLAEKASGQRIKYAYIGIGGIGLSSHSTEAAVAVTRADSQVTDLDLENLAEECRKRLPQPIQLNHRVLHKVPLSYTVDGHLVPGDPVGMKGVKFESKMLFVTCLATHVDDLIRVVEECDVEVTQCVSNPIAASLVALNKTQKIAGCVLANIGSETVSIVVYENGLPLSLEVFPIGSNDITNDIALGLRVSLEEAESIKLSERGAIDVPKRKLDEIVMARLSDIFELVDAHLKRIHRSGLLPAGIVITGGGSGVTTIEDLARAYLNLPSRVLRDRSSREKVEVKDSMWAVAYGLCIIALCDGGDALDGFSHERSSGASAFRGALSWFRQFLP